MSLDNPTMMEIYPYGGLCAYLKYNYIDGTIKQNVLLMDKTRFIHNKEKKIAVAQRPKSKEETSSMIAMFGIGSEAEEQINKVRKEIGD